MAVPERSAAPPESARAWAICGVLLLATMLNYMDRQTLSQTAALISAELQLSNAQYGRLELGFGLAFALGGLLAGTLADVVSVRWLYPAVVLGWSAAGFATAHSQAIGQAAAAAWRDATGHEVAIAGLSAPSSQTYLGLFLCRGVLGLFEAGQWPCALITTQRLLTRRGRTLGNSILQSGASLGAIATPLVVQWLVTNQPGSWRAPFAVIGAAGAAWVIPWFWLIGRHDLEVPPATKAMTAAAGNASAGRGWLVRRYVALVCVVVMINLTWHYFRAWLPKYLEEFQRYQRGTINYFTSAYYVATDVGCLAAGFAVQKLQAAGQPVHAARVRVFAACTLLTAVAVAAAHMPRGPLLLGGLLLIGAGSLGMFPIYYACSQELSVRNQGKITGSLSAITWVVTAIAHELIGRAVDAFGSHAGIMTIAGLLPLGALFALAAMWRDGKLDAPPAA